ncbi:MAG: hypothetical protein ACRC7N_01750 [Clostridium sp.]
MKKLLLSTLTIIQLLILFQPIHTVAIPPQTPSFTLPFKIKESVTNLNGDTLYAIEENGTNLYKIDLSTGAYTTLKFDLTIETIELKNNKLYVAQLISGHDYYATDPREGQISIVNPSNLTTTKSFKINQDPYDIAVDSKGFIYVSSGSGQHSDIKSYSEITKMQVSSTYSFSNSSLKLSNDEKILYSVESGISPADIDKHTLSNGKFINSTDSPYHGDYAITTSFFPSPDNKYVIFSSGVVFSQGLNDNYDLNYLYTIKDYVHSLEFNPSKNVFYGVNNEGVSSVYSYDTFTKLGDFNFPSPVDEIKLTPIGLWGIKKESNETIFNLITIHDYNTIPQNENKIYGDIVSSVHSKTKNKAYIVEKTFNRLYELDTNRNTITNVVELPYRPSSITLSEDENTLYIANNHPYMTVTSYNLNSKIFKHINFDMPKNCRDFAEKQIYINNNLIFVVDGDFNPKLYVFDDKTLSPINYGTELTSVGGITFDSEGKNFYTHKQVGFDAGNMITGISKYSIDGTTFTKVNEVEYPYHIIGRDPLFTPIFLFEKNNVLIFKDHVINMNDLNSYVKTFDESIYAISNNGAIASGKNGLYLLNRNLYASFDGVNSYNPIFFNNDGVLYLEKDNELIICSPIEGDVNGDTFVDILDISITSSSYNKKFEDDGYKFIYDSNSDKIIDIYDLVYIARNLENSQSFSIKMSN